MGQTPDPKTLALDVETAIEHARFADAIALLNDAGADSPPLNLLRARALYGLERFPAAMNEVNALLDGKLDARLRLRARSVHLRLMGVMSRTEDALAIAIDLARDADDASAFEDAADAHTEAAWLYGRMRCRPLAEARITRARALAEKAKAANNQDEPDFLARDIDLIEAFVFMQFDERKLALEAYRRAREIEGQSAKIVRIKRAATVGLARIHYLLGEFEAAHAELEALRPFAASDMRSRRGLIEVLSAEKKWSEVASLYAELRAASPKSSYSDSDDLSHALALYRAGDFDASRKAFGAIVSNSDDARDTRTIEARSIGEKLARPNARDLPKKRLYAFPSVAQLRNHCGPASCELYLRFFGITAAQIEIARAIKFPDGGTPVYRMRNYLEHAGFEARRIEAELPVLRKLIDLDIPVILEEDYSASRHVAVAIGYDDARGILEVQDPMTHAVRETSYEELAKIQAFSNAGALIAVPTNKPEMSKALDAGGILDCEYISLVDRAWALFDEEKFELADKLVENSQQLRRDYELSWIYKFQRAMREVEKSPGAENRVKLHRIVAEAEAIWPDDEWPKALHGDVAYSEDRYGEALIAFEEARDRDANDPSNWSKIADCQMAMGDLNGAKASLISCLSRDPSHSRATENLAYIYAEQNELTRATLLNDIALSTRPNNPFNHGVHRSIQLSRRNFEAACKDWEKMRALDPPRADRNLISHVRTLCKMRRFEEAETLLRDAAGKKDSRQQDCLTELGYVFYKAGEWTKAIAAADELMQVDHLGSVGPAQRGAAKLGSGDFAGGMADIDESLKRFPALSWALHKRGRALIEKDIERAIGALSASITLSPDVAETRYDLARAFEAVRCSAASIHLKKAAETGDLNESELTNVGALLVSMEGGRPANNFFTTLEQMFPNDIAIRRAHVKLLLESVWMPASGFDALKAIARIAPNDSFGKLGLGLVEIRRGMDFEADGEILARAAIAEIEADPSTAKLIFPRQILATELAAIARHEVVIELLAKSSGDYIDARLQIGSLIPLGRFDEAEAKITAFEAKYGRDGKPSASGVMLRFKVANAKNDYANALEMAKASGKISGERSDDGRLDDWEVEQFKGLLALGKTDEAISFGLAQAGDGNSLGRLAYAAIGQRSIGVAKKLAEDTLRLDPHEAYGFYVLGRVAELEGKLAEAKKFFEQTGDAARGWHVWAEELARMSLSEGDMKSAEKYALLAIERGGHTCFNALGLLAETHFLAGKIDQAKKVAARAGRFGLNVRGESEDIHGVVALVDGEHDRARQLFDVFLAKPNAASAVDRKRIDQVWGARSRLS
ncbi:MAG: tetratricopeptide repeat protein [Polyangiaceae bacterium]